MLYTNFYDMLVYMLFVSVGVIRSFSRYILFLVNMLFLVALVTLFTTSFILSLIRICSTTELQTHLPLTRLVRLAGIEPATMRYQFYNYSRMLYQLS